MKIVFSLLVVVGLVAGGGYYYMTHFAAAPPPNYRMAMVTRGDLFPTISATGTLEPEEVVDVGAQVGGRIYRLGEDKEVTNRKKGIHPPEAKKAAETTPQRPGAVQGQQRVQGVATVRVSATVAPPTPTSTVALASVEKKTAQSKPQVKSEPQAKPPSSPTASADTKAFPTASAETKSPPAAQPANPTPANASAEADAMLDNIIADDSLSGDLANDDPHTRVDYGSIVHAGTILALIDPTIYRMQYLAADASVMRSKADLQQAIVKRNQAKEDLGRADVLRKLPDIQGVAGTTLKAIADSDYTAVKANYDAAEANVGVCQAVLKQAEHTLKMQRTNLYYTIIQSPVDGVIVDRRVNVGQTVVAAFNAPSLFLLARDLSRMQVWVSVNEADIGRIKKGMKAKFTVDTFPGETFEGKVLQIRLNATMTQNVVTYTVVVETDNPDGRLLPYFTANVQFEVEDLHDVLRVPNAALRWKPRPSQIAPDAREKEKTAGRSGKGKDRQGGGKSPGDPATAKAAAPREERGRVWIKDEDGEYVRPIDVKIGSSDGSLTAVYSSHLKPDMEVIVGEEAPDQGAGEAENPFAPKLFKGFKKS